jgi:hypothetical protein
VSGGVHPGVVTTQDEGELDRSTYRLIFAEDFAGRSIDERRWVAHYLPQWTTPERSAARYDLHPGWATLRNEGDQPAWLPDDGELRVSNLQTATFSGPVDSERGTHRHRTGLRVRTAQTTRRLFTPSEGLVEARLRASADPTVLLALWLVGVEEGAPEESGEICVAELYGHSVGPGRSTVRMGIKAHHDPRLREDMRDVALDLDATDWHTYSATWTADTTRIYVDDQLIRTIDQGMAYPLQLMLDLFEFPPQGPRDPADYPKVGDVAAVRGWATGDYA